MLSLALGRWRPRVLLGRRRFSCRGRTARRRRRRARCTSCRWAAGLSLSCGGLVALVRRTLFGRRRPHPAKPPYQIGFEAARIEVDRRIVAKCSAKRAIGPRSFFEHRVVDAEVELDDREARGCTCTGASALKQRDGPGEVAAFEGIERPLQRPGRPVAPARGGGTQHQEQEAPEHYPPVALSDHRERPVRCRPT